MIKYEGTLINVKDDEDTGNAFVNATVTVRKAFTGDVVTLYSDNGITEIENPVKTDILGNYSFWVKSGLYRLVFNEGELSEKEQTDVLISGAGAIEVNTLEDLTSSSFPLGTYLEVDGMGKAPFLIMPSDTTIGVGDHRINNRLVAVLLKTKGYVKPEWYGAKGDGATDDYQAIQDAIDDNASEDTQIRFTSPIYRIGSQLNIDNTTNLTLIGDASTIQAQFTSNERLLGGTSTRGLYVKGLTFDMRYSVTGFGVHIVSLQNPRDCTFERCTFLNFAEFGVIMFTSDRGASGTARNNHIIDCYADGNSVSYGGGFGMESMKDSTISGQVVNVTGSAPGYAVNLKNDCNNCTTDVIVGNCNAGVVLSDDGPNTVGAGVKNSFIKGNVENCKFGATFNKTKNVHADLNIDCGGIAGGVGLGVFGFNTTCDYDVSIANCDPSGYAVTSRSDDQSIFIRRYDGSASKICNFEAGTDRNRLGIGYINYSGTQNLINFVDDNSGNTTNEVMYLRDCPSALSVAGTNSASMTFPLKGANRSHNRISVTDFGTMFFTVANENMLALESASNAISPAIDNTYSLGRAAYRMTEIFSASGTINTSDAREKTFLSIDEAERVAALEIKSNMRKFKFNSAIESKGDDARIHYGVSAQQVGEILTSHGLDPNDYGFFCHDSWLEDGVEKDRYGIRYEELLCFIMAAM